MTDIGPLAGMKLERLVLRGCRVVDLKPLAGMPLKHLDLDGTPADDLQPLADMPLKYLRLNLATKYRDPRVVARISSLETIGDVPVETWLDEHKYVHARRTPGAPPPKPPAPRPRKGETPPDIDVADIPTD